jgi:hypothetical protein
VLVFEFVDMDLKKFFSQFQRDKGMDPIIVKVDNLKKCLKIEFDVLTCKRDLGLSSTKDSA